MSVNPQKQKLVLDIEIKSMDMTEELIVGADRVCLTGLGENPEVYRGSFCEQQHRGGHRAVSQDGARQKREPRLERDCGQGLRLSRLPPDEEVRVPQGVRALPSDLEVLIT